MTRIGARWMLPLGGIASLALVLRVYALSANPLWYDEVMHVWICRHLTWETFSCQNTLIEPIFCLFLYLWLKLGSSDVWIRLHAVLGGMLTVAVAYGLGKRLSGPRGAWTCALFVACAPIMVFYSRDAKMYAWVSCLGLAVTYFAILYASEDGKPRHLIAYCVLAVALIHTHLAAPFYLATLNIGYVLFRARSIQKTVTWCAAQAAVILAAVPYLIVEHRMIQAFAGKVFWSPKPTPHSLLVTASNMTVGYAVEPWVRTAGIVLFGCLILLALAALRGRRSEAGLLVFAAVAQVIVLYFYRRNGNNYYVDRYLIGTAAPLLVVAGAGVARLPRAWLRWPVVAGVLVLFAVALGDLYAYRFTQDPRERMGVYRTVNAHALRDAIRAQAREGDVVLHVGWETAAQLRWYVPDLPHVLLDMGGRIDSSVQAFLPDIARDTYESRPQEIENAIQGARRVWLVIPAHSPVFDASHQGVRAWLAARASETYAACFDGRFTPIALYRFDLAANAAEEPVQTTAKLAVPGASRDETAEPEYLQLSAVTEPPSGGSVNRFLIENPTAQNQVATYQVIQYDASCPAPGFDRALGSVSGWALQLYRDRTSARMAYHTRVDAKSDAADTLACTTPLPPGVYDVFAERTVNGPDYPIPTGQLSIQAGTQTFVIPGTVPDTHGGWKWCLAGSFEQPDSQPLTVRVSAGNPEKQPEVMITFSRIVFVRHDEAGGGVVTPVVKEGRLTIPAGAAQTVEVAPQYASVYTALSAATGESFAGVQVFTAP